VSGTILIFGDNSMEQDKAICPYESFILEEKRNNKKKYENFPY
jgi:hypothetical protein